MKRKAEAMQKRYHSLATSVLFMVAGFICAVATNHAVRTELVVIKNIVVEAPVAKLMQRLQQQLQHLHDKPLYGAYLQQIAAQVAQHPQVKTVRVQPVFPHTLRIDVQQREPMATLKQQEQLFTVYDNGQLLAITEALDRSALLQIQFLPGALAGADRLLLLQRCVQIIQQHKQAAAPGGLIERIAVRPTGNMIVHLSQPTEHARNHLTVYLGGDDFKHQWQQVASVLLHDNRQLHNATLYLPHTQPCAYKRFIWSQKESASAL